MPSLKAVLLNDTRVDRHFGCDLVCSAIEHLLESSGFELAASSPAHQDWRRDRRFVETMRSAQLILINGEGTIHHNRPAGEWLLEVGSFAREHGIPSALINSGWEANGEAFEQRLKDFSLVSWRDSGSQHSVRHLQLDDRVVPDLSLYEVLRRVEKAPELVPTVRHGIGLTDSVDRRKTAKLLGSTLPAGLRSICIHHADHGPVRFVRDGISLREDLGSPSRFAKLVRARTALWRSRLNDVGSFISQVGSLELLISGRFHAATVALATRSPVVAFRSNTKKLASLFCDARLSSERNIDEYSIRSFDAASANWSPEEERNLDRYLGWSTSGAQELFRSLSEMAAAGVKKP